MVLVTVSVGVLEADMINFVMELLQNKRKAITTKCLPCSSSKQGHKRPRGLRLNCGWVVAVRGAFTLLLSPGWVARRKRRLWSSVSFGCAFGVVLSSLLVLICCFSVSLCCQSCFHSIQACGRGGQVVKLWLRRQRWWPQQPRC